MQQMRRRIVDGGHLVKEITSEMIAVCQKIETMYLCTRPYWWSKRQEGNYVDGVDLLVVVGP